MNAKHRLHNFLREGSIDNLGYQMLLPILKELDYVPYTSSALRPSALVTLLNDIFINNRKNIIEFGTGISTLVLAKFSQMNELNLNIYSVEEDEKWLLFIKKQLEKYQITNGVNLIYAPVKEITDGIKWHDLDFVKELPVIDCVMVDGPKAFTKENRQNRQYTLRAIKNSLAENNVVFLDDCHREAELGILREWAKELEQDYSIYYQHLGAIFSGDHFNVSI